MIGDLLLHMVFVGLAIAVNPVPIIAALVMPATRKPVLDGIVYVVTLVVVMALVGFVILQLLSDVARQGGDTTELVLTAFWTAIGLSFLVAFAVLLVRRPKPGKEREEPGWMRRIERMGPAGAALVGLLLVNYELEIPAMTQVLAADVGWFQGRLALVALVAVACSTPAITVGLYTTLPRQTAAYLGRGKALLTRWNRPILLVVFFAVGAWFAYKGVAGLVAR